MRHRSVSSVISVVETFQAHREEGSYCDGVSRGSAGLIGSAVGASDGSGCDGCESTAGGGLNAGCAGAAAGGAAAGAAREDAGCGISCFRLAAAVTAAGVPAPSFKTCCQSDAAP